jgi:GNAT superfamily N-acetyltransferase
MRCIGVNQYAGEHPAIIEAFKEYKEGYARARKIEKEKLDGLDPVDKFFHIVNAEVERPAKYSREFFHNYRFCDNALVVLERIGDDAFPDIEGCSRFIVLLRSIYVVDLYRSQNIGQRTIEQIKRIADRAGVVVILFAKAFGISKDGKQLNKFTSFEELWRACVEDWDVVDLWDWQSEVADWFYKKNGLTNICLHSPKAKPPGNTEEWYSGQFAYIPDKLKEEYRVMLKERLKFDQSIFCSKDFSY